MTFRVFLLKSKKNLFKVMGPPAYGRTQSQPYQVPLAILERKMERERRQEDSTTQVP